MQHSCTKNKRQNTKRNNVANSRQAQTSHFKAHYGQQSITQHKTRAKQLFLNQQAKNILTIVLIAILTAILANAGSYLGA